MEKYELFGIDENASLTAKINSIVQALNQVGRISNDVVRDWQKVMEWAMGEGLDEATNKEIETLIANGRFDELIQTALTEFNVRVDSVETQLAQSTNKLKNSESVLKYGADPTNTQDSTQAFIDAMQNNEIVLVPVGDFKINSAITIQSSYKVRKIIGIGRDSSRLFFTGTDGIINSKSGTNIEGIGIFGGTTGKGVKLLAPIQMRNFQVYNFDVGLDFTNQVHIVTSFIEKGIIAYNKSYGVKIVSGGNWQNNGITFKDLYIVKNGLDADTITSNATIGNGDGMYVDGGYAISIRDCVFEYNSGVGLRLLSNSYPLFGCSVNVPYFERNKYANMYIDNSSGTYSITNLSVSGEMYTEAGYTPVANALPERTLYVAKPNKLLGSFNGNYWGKYGFAERNFTTRRSNLLNAFPVNDIGDLSGDYPSNIVAYSGDSCFTITNAIGGATLYSELMYVDKKFDYIVSYDITKVGVSASPNLLFMLYDNDTNTLVASANTSLAGGSFGWQTTSSKITGLATSGTKKLRLYLNIEGTKPSDCEIYIKNIRLLPILTVIEDDLLGNGVNTSPLSANQGYQLDQKKLNLTGGTMSGALVVDASTPLKLKTTANDTMLQVLSTSSANYIQSTNLANTASKDLNITGYQSSALANYNVTATTSSFSGTIKEGGTLLSAKYAPIMVAVPASATASGTVGQTAQDGNYFYVCVATNTWKRVALTTW